ncbi:helix-turn-helix transcriptional regulator [Streptomyces odontomachi]|uniref:helix-turn-helix transcriptional regulator n=1 Tax=Streptomyces odontomachi TaxID=2944940 RepID=UPI00210930EA|nr:response regulator transcription factor [Streptomyces sp. ODS25]
MPEENVVRQQVRVAVVAPDTVTEAGLIHLLQNEERLRLVPPADGEAEVVVVAMDTVTDRTLSELSALPTRAATLVVCKEQWRADVPTAVERGVRAVLDRKNCSTATLVKTVLMLGHGGGALPATLQGKLLDRIRRTGQKNPDPYTLSPRETEILQLLSEGHSLRKIAARICYSERTVKNILYGVMGRLGCRSRTQAVSWAIRAGLI